MFKRGDIVIGNKYASGYLYTTTNTIWKVVDMHGNDTVVLMYDVNLKQPNNKLFTLTDGEIFRVDADCFELYNRTRKSHLPRWF